MMRRLFHASLFSLSLLVALTLVCFFLFTYLPGDAARTVLGAYASERNVAALRADWGLNKPLFHQWWWFLQGLFEGDMGHSLINQRPVDDMLISRGMLTLTLGGVSAVISLVGSYGINLIMWLRPDWRRLRYFALAGVLMPAFFSAMMVLVILGSLFPAWAFARLGTSLSHWYDVLIPAIIVALYPMALLTTLLEQRLQEQSNTLHALAERAWGYGVVKRFHRSLLRPAALPWLAAWLHQFSVILVATLVTEVVFSFPGLGTLLVSAVQQKDYPVIQAVILANGTFFVLLYWMQRMLLAWLDPRVRN